VLKPIKGNPGRFLDTASGQVLNIAEYREDDKYDSIYLPGAEDESIEIAFGSQYIFFRDIMTKRPIDCNFTQPSRLSAGEEMVVDRVGLYPRHCISSGGELDDDNDGDIVRVVENAYFRVNVNSMLLIEGPAFKFPSGYGLGGYAHYTSSLGIGVPSTAAAAKLVKTQILTSRHEVIGYLIFHDHDWILKEVDCPVDSVHPLFLTGAPGMIVTAFLHGLIKAAVNK